jgi:hypothetical protein
VFGQVNILVQNYIPALSIGDRLVSRLWRHLSRSFETAFLKVNACAIYRIFPKMDPEK